MPEVIEWEKLHLSRARLHEPKRLGAPAITISRKLGTAKRTLIHFNQSAAQMLGVYPGKVLRVSVIFDGGYRVGLMEDDCGDRLVQLCQAGHSNRLVVGVSDPRIYELLEGKKTKRTTNVQRGSGWARFVYGDFSSQPPEWMATERTTENAQ